MDNNSLHDRLITCLISDYRIVSGTTDDTILIDNNSLLFMLVSRMVSCLQVMGYAVNIRKAPAGGLVPATCPKCNTM